MCLILTHIKIGALWTKMISGASKWLKVYGKIIKRLISILKKLHFKLWFFFQNQTNMYKVVKVLHFLAYFYHDKKYKTGIMKLGKSETFKDFHINFQTLGSQKKNSTILVFTFSLSGYESKNIHLNF